MELVNYRTYVTEFYTKEELRLKENLDHAQDNLWNVDQEALRNKTTLEQLKKIADDRTRLSSFCNSSLAYVTTELAEIDGMLTRFVCDVCIAAAIFARVAPFREQIRQVYYCL